MSNPDPRLPSICYAYVPGNPPERAVVIIKRGESGYYPSRVCPPAAMTPDEIKALVNSMNEDIKVTSAMSEAMLVGSMFGWDVPGAHLKE